MSAHAITPTPLCAALIIAFSGPTSRGALSGFDDFNDNSRDTGKWYAESTFLQETNQRLEFTASGIGDAESHWAWIANSGSYNQDWTVSIEAFNSSSPSAEQWSHIMLAVLNSADDTDIFATALGADPDAGAITVGGWEVNGIECWDAWQVIAGPSATLRISYDSTIQTLSSEFDAGEGFVLLTNFNVNGWNMASSDTFIVAIGGVSESNFAISSGELYADNFKASTAGPAISNHLDFVLLAHCRDFGDPTTYGDDQYTFNFNADTDASITNVALTTPANERLIAASDGLAEGMQTWRHETTETSPLTNRFENGNYTVSVTYTNGSLQSTVIPYPVLEAVTMQPTFTAPSPLHNAMFSPLSPSSSNTPITLHWADIDPNANVVDLHRHHIGLDDWESLGLFTDLVPFSDGPLSTRNVGPIAFSPGIWGIEHFNGNAVADHNADGVFYVAINEALSEYVIHVLEAIGDADSDTLPNWWESLYFLGPTNAMASQDADLDGHVNWEEYITGMDPTNAASAFAVTNLVTTPEHVLIEWPSISGRVYRVFWTTNLLSGFQPLESGITHPRNSCTDTVHSAENECFYQLDVYID